MSEFFDRIYEEAQQLESIEQQRAFYEQKAATIPDGYAEGYDTAAALVQNAIESHVLPRRMPLYVGLQQGTVQGFCDFLQTPTSTIEAMQTYVAQVFGGDVHVIDKHEDMSVFDAILFAASRKVPTLPMLRICLGAVATNDHAPVKFPAPAAA
jgi:hypothetical protein